MTDYRTLPDYKQQQIVQDILDTFPKVQVGDVLTDVSNGVACAYCFMMYYNCLCSEDAE